MSDFDESSTPSLDPKSPQSYLLTRIAAVLSGTLAEQAYTLTLDIQEPHILIVDGQVDLLHLADALIRKLGLHVVTVGDFQTVIKGSYPNPLEES